MFLYNQICSGKGIYNNFSSVEDNFVIKFKLLNSASLKEKLSFFIPYLKDHPSTIFCVTETWFKKNLTNSELVGDSNFSIVRADRAKGIKTKGGGVCLYIPKHFSFTIKQTPSIPNVEYLCVDFFFASFFFTLIVVYLPPDCNSSTFSNFCESITPFLSSNVLLVGDFNLPGINWSDFSTKTAKDKVFLDFLSFSNLKNFVNTPTRYDNILDLVVSSPSSKISDIIVESNPLSDHDIVNFSLACDGLLPSFPSYSFKNFKKANYDAINFYFFDYQWEFLSKGFSDLELAYEEFVKVVQNAIFFHVDIVIPSSSDKLPNNVKAMIKYRNSIPRNKQNLKQISLISKRILKLSIKSKRDRESLILKNFGKKGIFNYLGKFLKIDTHVPALKAGSLTIFSDEDKATNFAQNFLSYYHPQKSSIDHNPCVNDNSLPLFTQSQVSDILKKLKPKCNTSPDGIPYILLKRCAFTLARPITKLLNLSFMQGKVPSLWKLSHIVPIFKKGDKHFSANYRPISLNCSLSAVPQKIVIDFLSNFFYQKKIIPSCQHGFTKSKSVTTQLLETFDFVSSCADKNIPVDIIYLDMVKAFDRLKHSILFSKLKKHGVPNSIIAWIQAFLTNRKFRVKLGEALSDFFDANSGVPQGSKLGPLLFSFFVSDLISFCLTPDVLDELFADDLKILSAILTSLNNPLQTFLSKLEVWMAENELEISISKCNVLHCLPKVNPKISYFFNGFKIPNNQTSIRDLGIIVSDDLSWDEHINTISKKALARLFILFRSLKSRSSKLLVHMYHTYVRPLVEFSTPVFNPSKRFLIDKLEKVQKVALRLIFYRCKELRPFANAPYEEKLEKLGLDSLESRRNKFDLTFLNDYLCGNIKLKLDIATRISKTRGSTQKIVVPKSKKTIRRNFFSVRASSNYIKLPRDVQYSNSKAFKSSLAALKV